MSRHVADERTLSTRRASRFVEIARKAGEEGSHPSTRAVMSRQAEGGTSRRLAEFLRIERGRTA